MNVDVLASRFWSKVERHAPEDCWEWKGAKFVQAYGKLFIGRDDRGVVLCVKAHRLAWELANGRAVPAGLGILHSCDNPPCVNPAHLRCGTPKDNARMTARRVGGIATRLAKPVRRRG